MCCNSPHFKIHTGVQNRYKNKKLLRQKLLMSFKSLLRSFIFNLQTGQSQIETFTISPRSTLIEPLGLIVIRWYLTGPIALIVIQLNLIALKLYVEISTSNICSLDIKTDCKGEQVQVGLIVTRLRKYDFNKVNYNKNLWLMLTQ